MRPAWFWLRLHLASASPMGLGGGRVIDASMKRIESLQACGRDGHAAVQNNLTRQMVFEESVIGVYWTPFKADDRHRP